MQLLGWYSTRLVFSSSMFVHISSLFSQLHSSEQIALLFWCINVNTIWRQRTYVTNYVDHQTLKPDRQWLRSASSTSLDVRCTWLYTIGDKSISCRRLQPLVCGAVFIEHHCCPPLSIFCSRLKSHLFSFSWSALGLFFHKFYSVSRLTRHFGL